MKTPGKKRFSDPSTKNVMSGILLASGPVTTLSALRCVSRVFHNSVTKSKFTLAAKRLEAANMGNLVSLTTGRRPLQVFIKRPPVDIQDILQCDEYNMFCTPKEYTEKYTATPSRAITPKMKSNMVSLGLVSPSCFKEQTY